MEKKRQYIIETNKKRVRDRLTQVFYKPGVKGTFLIRDINEEGTDFTNWGLRLFSSTEIDQIIIDSDLITAKTVDPATGHIEYKSLYDFDHKYGASQSFCQVFQDSS